MSRPEDILPPDLYYNDHEAQKYTTSSRIRTIQSNMTHRALELLSLSQPSLILDIGCGSGLSGEILTEQGHVWAGMDISASMLAIALDRDADGDLLLSDIGQGIPFRPGSFDAAISISAIQWLCNADYSSPSPCSSSTNNSNNNNNNRSHQSHQQHSPMMRLNAFFTTLYMALKRGGKAVCQFYPKDDIQKEMITSAAIKAGFGAGLLVDDPDTKNQKLYLVLTVGKVAQSAGGGGGMGDITDVVAGMEGVEVYDSRAGSGINNKQKRPEKEKKGSKAWILRKKEQARMKGKVMKADSKYTGRKRRPQF